MARDLPFILENTLLYSPMTVAYIPHGIFLDAIPTNYLTDMNRRTKMWSYIYIYINIYIYILQGYPIGSHSIETTTKNMDEIVC